MFEHETIEAEREAQYLNEENTMVDKRTQREWAAQDQKEKLVNALKVLVLTPHVRAYLAVMDPKALEQAQQALGLPVSRGGSAPLVELMETFRGSIFREVERLRVIDAQEDEREDRKEAMAETDTRKFCDKCDGVIGGDCECPLETMSNDGLLAKVATFGDAAPPLPSEPSEPSTVNAAPECDCSEKAPADRYWVCPKCDAEWFPEEA